MIDHVPKPRPARPKPSASIRFARVGCAAMVVTTAAVIFPGSFT